MEMEIEDWRVSSFIRSTRCGKLYECMTDKECAGCTKRTRFTDKTLFPELDHESDSCMDRECYTGKLKKLLAGNIKKLAAEHPSHAGVRLIGESGGTLKSILGKSFFIGKDEYTIVPYSWDNRADKETNGAVPCLETEAGFEFSASYRVEKKPSKKAESPFAPIVRMLELPRAEAKAVLEALQTDKKQDTWKIENSIREKAFWKLLEWKAVHDPDDEKNIDGYIAGQMGNSAERKKTFKLFTGKDFSASGMRKLSWGRIFTLLAAFEFHDYNCPRKYTEQDVKSNSFLKWTGMEASAVKQAYKEAAEEVLKPKAKAPEKKAPEKAGKKRRGMIKT